MRAWLKGKMNSAFKLLFNVTWHKNEKKLFCNTWSSNSKKMYIQSEKCYLKNFTSTNFLGPSRLDSPIAALHACEGSKIL